MSVQALRARSAGWRVAAAIFSVTTLVWAVEPAGGAPESQEAPQLDTAAPESASGEADAQDDEVEPAETNSRSWLRAPSSKEKASDGEAASEPSGTPWQLLAVLLLAGLAGGAMLVRLRRRPGLSVLARSPIRVLSSTKVGPKASLVAVEVDGRVLLIGVTDASINELGWLENDSQNDADADESGESAPSSSQVAGLPRGFKDVLGGFLGGSASARRAAGGVDVSPMLAESTRDVLRNRVVAPRSAESTPTPLSRRSTRSAPLRTLNAGVSEERFAEPDPTSTPPARVEAQAAGLLRRRR